MKRIAIIFVLSLVAFLANAQAYQPMVSRALLDKRITEVNSNVNATAQELRSALDRVQTMLISNANAMAQYELPATDKQNMDVASCLLSGSYFTDAHTPGLYLRGCSREYNCYLAWDKVARNPSCYSNKLTHVYCWLQTSVSGSTTNESYTLTTPDGSSFGQSQLIPPNKVVLTSTTNSAYKVQLDKIELFQSAWDVILGQ